MGVYIKSMEMPENCDRCPCSNDLGCAVKNIVMPSKQMSEKHPEWCPLVELPKKHGRLVDGDELKTAFPACDNSKPVTVACVRATINHMPTVIGAEGSDQ